MANYDYKFAYLTITTQDGLKKRIKFYGRTQREAEKKESQGRGRI